MSNIPIQLISGKLPRKNVSLQEALTHLRVEDSTYMTPEKLLESLGGTRSYYHEKFHLGASIQPRRFWYVRIVKHDSWSGQNRAVRGER